MADVPSEHLRGQAELTVARNTLGVTLWLSQPAVWARGGVAAALSAFLRHAPVSQLDLYTTSTIPDWHRVSPAGISSLVDALSTTWYHGSVRHLFAFQLVDDHHAPSVGFSYREIDERRGRPGWLQMMLPQQQDPATLLSLVREVASQLPWLCGVGGFVASWNDWEKGTAFTTLHRWARRYLGIDVQDPDAMAWLAPTGLPGTNWLTLVSDDHAARIGLDARELAARAWKNDIEVVALGSGTLVRAGQEPTLGDINELGYPSAYAEVARTLERWFVPDAPRYWGAFWDDPATSTRWLRRFVEPDGWQ